MQESVCLDCEGPLSIPTNLYVGDSLICPRCQTELEIINLDPPKVDWPHDSTYDDWDEDYDDDDDLDDDWLDDDDDWIDDDDDDDYSWMLAKQKRHQELDELDRRRPPRPESTRGNAARSATRRVDTRRRNKEPSWDS